MVGSSVIDSISLYRDPRTGTQSIGSWASRASHVARLGARTAYLDPKSMQNNSPKPIITTIKAIILRTLGVQVGLTWKPWPPSLCSFTSTQAAHPGVGDSP